MESDYPYLHQTLRARESAIDSRLHPRAAGRGEKRGKSTLSMLGCLDGGSFHVDLTGVAKAFDAQILTDTEISMAINLLMQKT